MKEFPVISVVVPTYNSELYIEECLLSITSQTLSNIEILVIDDGSTDKTCSIVQHYADLDSRIRLIRCEHKGAGPARNCGCEQARGEYLSFLDSDDVFDAQMLEKAYGAAKKYDSDIVVFQYREMNTETGTFRYGCEANKCAAPNGNDLPSGFEILRKVSPSPWNKLFRRKLIEKYRLKFQDLSSCNDFAFTKSALLVAERVHFLNEELLSYRRHGQNISSTRYRHAENIIEAGNELLSFIKRHFPGEPLQQFYELMLFHCAHEYRCFPEHEDSRPYVAKVMAFLPWKYRVQFVKKIMVFQIRQHLRQLFRV